MLCNLHTHSTYCDGKNTLEQMVQGAIEQGFASIGFSGHGYTPYDLTYCMKDTGGYIAQVRQLQTKYEKEIEIYLGVEEDADAPIDRNAFDYILGSSHYCGSGGIYYPIDHSYEGLKKCLAAFGSDPLLMARSYYENFCRYIHSRKPDIVGHFDLLTKYDEKYAPVFLDDARYHKLAEEYMTYAASTGCLFEVNTGAIAKGLRTTPYPCENLLHILRKNKNGIVLNADAHSAEHLAFAFKETKQWLKDIGFREIYVLRQGKFAEDKI